MGHWNHRVMKRIYPHDADCPCGDCLEPWYSIHEVFYDEGGGLSWTEDEIAPGGSSIEELRTELERMLAALDKPVLDYDDEKEPTEPNA